MLGLSPLHQCHGCEVGDATFAPGYFTIHAAFTEHMSLADRHIRKRGHPQFIEMRMVERFLSRNDPQGSKNLASQSTDRGASCSHAAMGAREKFDSVARVESAHRGYRRNGDQ
jgi:hypothetical protein